MPWKDIKKKRAYQRKRMNAWRALHPEEWKRISKSSYLRHRERRLQDTREWRMNNPHKLRASNLVKSAKRRAKELGLPFELNTVAIADRIKLGYCEATGLKFMLSAGLSPWSPSLDRFDPLQGYTLANVRVVVWIYNCAKNEFTDADVQLLAESVVAKSAEKIAPSIVTALKG